MLTLYKSSGERVQGKIDLSVTSLPADIIWIDLLDPDSMESKWIERCTGMHVPQRDELSEIESSSRLKLDGETLYLSAPIIFGGGGSPASSATPVGFALARDRLITVRFQELTAFHNFVQQAQSTERPRNSAGYSSDCWKQLLITWLTSWRALVQR